MIKKMSELDNHFSNSEIEQNLLNNIEVGRDINIETIQQIAQQIIVNKADKHSSNQVIIQILELLKTNNGDVKKSIILQILKNIQYDEDLPIEAREDAKKIYTEIESLNPYDLFKTANHVNHKLAFFLLNIMTWVPVGKLKKTWNYLHLVDNYNIDINKANAIQDETIQIDKIQIFFEEINKTYILSNDTENSDTETSEFQNNIKHQNIYSNAEREEKLDLNLNINSELNSDELMLAEIIQESHLENETIIQNLLDMEVQESIVALENTEKLIISDSNLDFTYLESSLDVDTDELIDNMSEVIDNSDQDFEWNELL